eukprot:1939952-Prymnesium_polylepis.1
MVLGLGSLLGCGLATRQVRRRPRDRHSACAAQRSAETGVCRCRGFRHIVIGNTCAHPLERGGVRYRILERGGAPFHHHRPPSFEPT